MITAGDVVYWPATLWEPARHGTPRRRAIQRVRNTGARERASCLYDTAIPGVNLTQCSPPWRRWHAPAPETLSPP